MTMKTVKYISRIPRKPLAPGHIVVHNHVRPDLDPERRADGIESMADVTIIGMNGFRAWIASEVGGSKQHYDVIYEVERCACGWAPTLAEHYRVRFTA